VHEIPTMTQDIKYRCKCNKTTGVGLGSLVKYTTLE